MVRRGAVLAGRLWRQPGEGGRWVDCCPVAEGSRFSREEEQERDGQCFFFLAEGLSLACFVKARGAVSGAKIAGQRGGLVAAGERKREGAFLVFWESPEEENSGFLSSKGGGGRHCVDDQQREIG